MSLMIGELYDALVEAGSSETKARSAAVAVAEFEARFSKLEHDVAVLKWITGANFGLCLLILGKVLTLP